MTQKIDKFYVCGFLFSTDMNNFVLIKKNKEPVGTKMIGHWNGVGGKIREIRNEHPLAERGSRICIETPHAAMSREFNEETGVFIPDQSWHCFHIQTWSHTGIKVYYFFAAQNSLWGVRSAEEEVKICEWHDIYWGKFKILSDVHYLLHMIRAHVKDGTILCLNPEGINIEKQNPSGVMVDMGSTDADDTSEHRPG